MNSSVMSAENLHLKNLLVLGLSITIILSSCSPPKYSYYFNTYSPKSSALAKTDRFDMPEDSVTTADHSFLHIRNETLMASTSNELAALPNNEVKFEAKSSDATARNVAITGKKGIVKKWHTVKKIKLNVPRGDENKNRFAKVGLIFSILGLVTLPLVFAMGFAGLLISIPLAIVGIVLSSKGMKSEKHGVAITGLILGLLVFNLILIGLIGYLAMGPD